jgi:protein gp37
MKADWVREIRDQCLDHDVAFFFKQWGGLRPKSGSRELAGKEWRQFPKGQTRRWHASFQSP